jgi:hypothetical protein
MSHEKRCLFERLLLLHGVPFRNYTGTLLVLDCGTADGAAYARWVPCPKTERGLYRWLGY